MCTKTMQDCLDTAKKYEYARYAFFLYPLLSVCCVQTRHIVTFIQFSCQVTHYLLLLLGYTVYYCCQVTLFAIVARLHTVYYCCQVTHYLLLLLGYTLFTIVARLQYDTYRSEHEQVIHSGGSGSQKSAEIRQKYEERKKKYEQLKSDMVVKMQFLDENKVRLYDSCLLYVYQCYKIIPYLPGECTLYLSVLPYGTACTWRVYFLPISVTM